MHHPALEINLSSAKVKYKKFNVNTSNDNTSYNFKRVNFNVPYSDFLNADWTAMDTLEDIVRSFGKYFGSVYDVTGIDTNFSNFKSKNINNSALILPVFAEDDVINVAKNLKAKIFSVLDIMSSFIVKNTERALVKPLCKIFNLSLWQVVYPEC